MFQCFSRRQKVKLVAIIVLVVLAPPPQAEPVVLSIAYGRSWPQSIVVDSARHLVYIDGLSGLYPPGGFSFGVINSSSLALISVLPLGVTAGELALDGNTGTVYVAGNESIAVYDGRSRTFVRTIGLKLPVYGMAFDASTGYLFLTSDNSVLQLDPTTGSVLRSALVGNSGQGIAVDSSRGEILVASYLSASVSVLRSSDLSRVATVLLPQSFYPARLALDEGRGMLYVTTDERWVARVSLWNDSLVGNLIASTSDANGTYALAIDSARNRLFVAAEPGESVAELDASTGAFISNFALESAAVEMAVDSQSGRLYVTDYHQVTVITPPDIAQGGQQWLLRGELAALIGLAAAVAVGLVIWIKRKDS